MKKNYFIAYSIFVMLFIFLLGMIAGAELETTNFTKHDHDWYKIDAIEKLLYAVMCMVFWSIGLDRFETKIKTPVNNESL